MYSPTFVKLDDAPIWKMDKPKISTTKPIANITYPGHWSGATPVKDKISTITTIGLIDNALDLNAERYLFFIYKIITKRVQKKE